MQAHGRLGSCPPRAAGSLLSAHGPFLLAASESGFHCYGIDISPSAVEYVRKTLGIEAVASDFLKFDPAAAFGRDRYGCLTMWYVIEHFEDVHAVLTQAARLVKPGGVFAFSTPNSAGITGKSI